MRWFCRWRYDFVDVDMFDNNLILYEAHNYFAKLCKVWKF